MIKSQEEEGFFGNLCKKWMKNYFQILNVTEDAEKEVIIASYKALAKKYHPDSSQYDQKTSSEKMALINEAYEVLSDDVKRRAYLESLKESSYESERYESDDCGSETNWEWSDDDNIRYEDGDNRGDDDCNRGDDNYDSKDPVKGSSTVSTQNQADLETEEGVLYKFIKVALIIAMVVSLLFSFIHFGLGGMLESRSTISQLVEDILYNFHLK